MSQEQQTSKPQTDAAPVIIWERKVERTNDTNSKVISIDDYRRHGSPFLDSEATVSIQDISASPSGEPIRLRIVSSGFGQKPSYSGHTVQSLAA
ncbi:hypothetical protein [Paenibacillus sedimenti]|uniref:Uncharacterized protein n=1 Tax=Paenibacillus sedimenti TaxID=2770274 RepID=A0A926KUT9_9BACL|nr:hypothetical protein [Paenibacillus sedimenti]MBD0383718.1 hypothetical protein [Paenibacillus sedimenti]